MTLLLIVIGACIGGGIATWQAKRRRRIFFTEMLRRQIELGPVVPTVWANSIMKFNAEVTVADMRQEKK